jgi:hypothetical protein
MIQYVGDFMKTSIAAELENGERTLILVTHDESCFGSNDGWSYCWIDENNRQIRPKGNGRSVMVSAFLCECHGVLKLSEELQAQHQDIPADSTAFLKPGANCEGYWKNNDLDDQAKERLFQFSEYCIPTVMSYLCSKTARTTTPNHLMR